ncbi:MAG: hypothetical protein AAB653_02325 [Patescibacteria group bacterium]
MNGTDMYILAGPEGWLQLIKDYPWGVIFFFSFFLLLLIAVEVEKKYNILDRLDRKYDILNKIQAYLRD